MEVFLYKVEATASERDNKYRAGSRHAALVFALAIDVDDGIRKAKKHMHNSGWDSVDIIRCKQLKAELMPTMEESMQAPYRAALEFGTAAVIYDISIS